ncbi:YagU family protein [Serratia sp. NPDC078593]|uniref:YagU family protein n=1 Tax=unclassified Serratia (in: enterobacteria) TaxID=2647522 RepID=UPI0037D1292B
MQIKDLFLTTDPKRRRYGVAIFVGIIAGIMSAFVKWGAEVPLPPRTIADGRNEFNPPYLFLRDYLGIDPTSTVYTFSEHIINPVMVTHILFSLVFAIGYCVVAECFPKVKMWQGAMAGLIATVAVHGISFPLLGLTPSLSMIPIDEYISEILGHVFWFWAIELIRRDLRNRITHEPDAEVPLTAPYR